MNGKEILSANLKRLMAEKGVIASAVCKELGFRNNTFSNWLNGKSYPKMKALNDLADYFECDLSELIEDAEVELKPCQIKQFRKMAKTMIRFCESMGRCAECEFYNSDKMSCRIGEPYEWKM